MVVTRSHCPLCKANGGRHDARDHNRGTDADIRGDAARVAAAHRTSARRRGKKGVKTLKPSIPREDKHKRGHRRRTVSTRDTNNQDGGREATHETKPRNTARPTAITTNGRGSKPDTKASQQTGSGSGPSGQSHASESGRRGMKRAREDEDDIPGSAAPARQIRRRIDAPPREGTRRSARLAPRRPAQAPHALSNRATAPALRTSPDPEQSGPRQALARLERTVESQVEERGVLKRTPDPSVKSEHDDGCSTGSEVKTESSGRTLVASEPNVIDVPQSPSEQSLLPPYPVKKEEEEVDLALGTGPEFERSPSVAGMYDTDTDDSGSRSSSVEPFELATPEPPGEAGPVRVYDGDESLSTLGIMDVDEDDQEEFLPLQLPNGGFAGENDDEDEEHENVNGNEDDNESRERSRSLAPEPEEGLLAEIRLGRIPDLATPERSITE